MISRLLSSIVVTLLLPSSSSAFPSYRSACSTSSRTSHDNAGSPWTLQSYSDSSSTVISAPEFGESKQSPSLHDDLTTTLQGEDDTKQQFTAFEMLWTIDQIE